VLWLRPADGKRDAIALPLSRDRSKREMGPIPAGDYRASLVA
jgi:hypothetical protein